MNSDIRIQDYLKIEKAEAADLHPVICQCDHCAKLGSIFLSLWLKIIDSMNPQLGQHSRRVGEMTLSLSNRLGYQVTISHPWYWGAVLHDIGKLTITKRILNKPSLLTADEMSIVRLHPIMGQKMLRLFPTLYPSSNVLLFHHERWNGCGYPFGLAGEKIPVIARILAVLDVFDALRHERSYRQSWSHETTVNYIRNQAGILFDPSIVKEFLEMITISDPVTIG